MEIVWGAKGQHGLSGDQTAHVDLSLAEMWAFQVMQLTAQWIGEDVSGIRCKLLLKPKPYK